MTPEVLPLLSQIDSLKCETFDLIIEIEGSSTTEAAQMVRKLAITEAYNDLLKVRHGANDHVKKAYAKSYCEKILSFSELIDNANCDHHQLECNAAMLTKLTRIAQSYIITK